MAKKFINILEQIQDEVTGKKKPEINVGYSPEDHVNMSIRTYKQLIDSGNYNEFEKIILDKITGNEGSLRNNKQFLENPRMKEFLQKNLKPEALQQINTKLKEISEMPRKRVEAYSYKDHSVFITTERALAVYYEYLNNPSETTRANFYKELFRGMKQYTIEANVKSPASWFSSALYKNKNIDPDKLRSLKNEIKSFFNKESPNTNDVMKVLEREYFHNRHMPLVDGLTEKIRSSISKEEILNALEKRDRSELTKIFGVGLAMADTLQKNIIKYAIPEHPEVETEIQEAVKKIQEARNQLYKIQDEIPESPTTKNIENGIMEAQKILGKLKNSVLGTTESSKSLLHSAKETVSGIMGEIRRLSDNKLAITDLKRDQKRMTQNFTELNLISHVLTGKCVQTIRGKSFKIPELLEKIRKYDQIRNKATEKVTLEQGKNKQLQDLIDNGIARIENGQVKIFKIEETNPIFKELLEKIEIGKELDPKLLEQEFNEEIKRADKFLDSLLEALENSVDEDSPIFIFAKRIAYKGDSAQGQSATIKSKFNRKEAKEAIEKAKSKYGDIIPGKVIPRLNQIVDEIYSGNWSSLVSDIESGTAELRQKKREMGTEEKDLKHMDTTPAFQKIIDKIRRNPNLKDSHKLTANSLKRIWNALERTTPEDIAKEVVGRTVENVIKDSLQLI